MKKLLFLFVATASLMVSCDKNDESLQDQIPTLLGDWELKDFSYVTKINGTIVPNEEAGISIQVDDLIEFKENNVVITSKLDNETNERVFEQGTYEYNDSSKKLTFTFFDTDSQQSYKQNFDVLSFQRNELNLTNNVQIPLPGQSIELDLKFNYNRKNNK